MNFDRRAFLKSAIGTAGAAALSGPLFAAVAPTTLAADPRRPQFHLLPAANWMNDPNGPLYWNGKYHMFYQYNPNGAFWGDMHWAHAMSPDMVHWTHLPIALSPTPGSADAQGCFSGTAQVRDGVVNVIYTGVVSAPADQATIRDGTNSLRESQCLATSSDPLLRTWTKRPAPVIADPPPGLQVSGFRDPSPWGSGEEWYMVVGSGIPKQGGAILLYRSKDLVHWDYLHVLTHGEMGPISAVNPVDSGDMWECPDFFPLGNKHVLIYATEGKVLWESGEFDTRELVFHPEHCGVLDYGSFYAAKTQTDKSGNRILWGWIQETRPLEEYRASGWAGMMSLPRVLNLDKDGQVMVTVAAEVRALRAKQQTLRIAKDENVTRGQLDGMRLRDCCGEILCTVRKTEKPFELALATPAMTGPGSGAPLRLRYDPAHPDSIELDGKAFAFPTSESEELEMHFYVDGSVIEALIDKKIGYTKRFYYPGEHAPEIQVQIVGSMASLSSLTMWQITPISSNRLTV